MIQMRGVILLLVAGAVNAAPAAPDSVWFHSFDKGTLTVCWTEVKGAEEYRLWRVVQVSVAWDREGNQTDLEEPRTEIVSWAVFADPEVTEGIVTGRISIEEGDSPVLFGISATVGEEDSDSIYFFFDGTAFEIVEHPEGLPTGVLSRSWGDLKARREDVK